MGRKVKLFWLLLGFPASLFSQASDTSIQIIPETFYYKRIFIGINYGAAFSMGSFSGENLEFNNSGFAKRGTTFNFLDFGYRIGSTLGFTGYLFNSNNPLDKVALIDKLNSNESITIINAEVGEYQLRGMMLGLLVSKYGNLVDFDLKFMGGIANFSVPSTIIMFREQSNTEIITENYLPISDRSFGVGFGFGLRIHLNQHVDFTTNANYLIFQNSFTRTIDSQTNLRVEEFELTHETFNLSFGIAYRFLNDVSILNRK